MEPFAKDGAAVDGGSSVGNNELPALRTQLSRLLYRET
jgi:hypothetical protein